MRTVIALLTALLLGACGGNNSPPHIVVNPVQPPTSGGWAITQASAGLAQQLPSASFAFPQCASAQTCWVSYVEIPYGAVLNGAQTAMLSWTISGTSPVFVNDTKDNTCGGAAALSLFLHMAGDNGMLIYGRWFSKTRAPLALGAGQLRVPIAFSEWTGVYPNADAVGFGSAITHLGSIGLVLGGGCFAGHGVAVSNGSATLQINGMSIQ